MAYHLDRYTINHWSDASRHYPSQKEAHQKSVGIVEFSFTGEEIEFLSRLSRTCLKDDLYVDSMSKNLLTKLEQCYRDYCDYNCHSYKLKTLPLEVVQKVSIF